MRKQLLAIFSSFGLASSSASASAQVLKGSDEANKTTTETKIKGNKTKQEKQNTLDAGSKDTAKVSKAGTENAAGKSDAQLTMRKAGGEQQAQQDVVTEKIGADNNAHKHIGGVKYEKQSAEQNAAKTDVSKKAVKTGVESDSSRSYEWIKASKKSTHASTDQNNAAIKGDKSVEEVKRTKNAAESQAAQQDLQKKVDKATPK